MVATMSASGGDLTQVGGVSLADQLAEVPPLQGIVDQVVAGIYQAFSQAIGDTFWLGLAATLLALVVVSVGLRDVPLRALVRRRRQAPTKRRPRGCWRRPARGDVREWISRRVDGAVRDCGPVHAA